MGYEAAHHRAALAHYPTICATAGWKCPDLTVATLAQSVGDPAGDPTASHALRERGYRTSQTGGGRVDLGCQTEPFFALFCYFPVAFSAVLV